MSTTETAAAPKVIRREDYQPPAYLIDRVDLTFDLALDGTSVVALSVFRRNPEAKDRRLVLDGVNLELVSARLNGRALTPETDYRLAAQSLEILDPPESFTLELATRIHPETNTELEGLYMSGGMFCTQCEAQGFRRITFFPDRPDVLARFTTTIRADAKAFPVLLSNGNPVASGALDGGRHFVTWNDPFPKPAYLFALVAGDLAVLEDRFTTRSGRDVALRIYTRAPDIDKCDHAMASLKRAMRWDEEVFGLEYDLDIFMIVAVGDFNMGAMENKGLNIFNTKYVLASPESATDNDFLGIETVIGHEYFHNWTGNRVTCRDWFQLSLKEGLTVFRDQQFSGDMASRAVKRIADVEVLRAAQFPEDASPMAHPIRPESYIEINNFYTPTVYNKGAEVVRMMHTLLGVDGFRRGMDLYFLRHDGRAVTCEDFVAAMEDANGVDLGQFRRWYEQAGTPELSIDHAYDGITQTLTLTVSQSCPATPGQPEKDPFHIPLALGLVGLDGADLPLQLEGEDLPNHAGTRVLDIRKPTESFTFINVAERPTPSLLRDFSAPVKLKTSLTDRDLAFLSARDTNPFARWEAGQAFACRLILRLVEDRAAGRDMVLDPRFTQALAASLGDVDVLGGPLDPAFVAQAIRLPGLAYLSELTPEIDIDGLHAARKFLRCEAGGALAPQLAKVADALEAAGLGGLDSVAFGRRALDGMVLGYRVAADEAALPLAIKRATQGRGMTEVLTGLSLLADSASPERETVFQAFHEKWRHDALVIDKWFALQAMADRPEVLTDVVRLMSHPDFDLKNPNRARSLIASFASGNPVWFHAKDGSGYRFLADRVLEIDPMNGSLAGRFILPLTRWHRYDAGRKALMRAELERIVAVPGLSKSTYEVVSKSLEG